MRYLPLLLLLACERKDTDTDPGTDPGTEADTEPGTDTGTDIDTDTEPDTEPDTDDAGPPRMYMTARVAGNLGGISAADALCESDPARPPGGSTFKALLGGTDRVACTSANCEDGTTGRVDWVLQPNQTYVIDGVDVMTTNADAIFTGTLMTDLRDGELNFWTGLDADWTLRSPNCSQWTSDVGNGAVGWSHSRNEGRWLNGNVLVCTSLRPVLCVEQTSAR